MNRAYSILDVKSVSDGDRVMSGVASTPKADRMGDVVNPLGAKFKLPMPLLWQHDHSQPIGTVEFAKPTESGIPFSARIASLDDPGTLKNRLDEAWQSIKLGLVRAVSIGFAPIKYSLLKDGGYEFDEWEWLELSAVTIPANADCAITTIKSADRLLRREAGIPDPEILPPPELAAIGNSARVVRLNAPARDGAPFVIRSIKRIRA
ncbi:HK97 family phage prohead protease [Sphingomonas nostoxanthinifaciens]|uniref:HK97 family phage prohead protease n=1 Tax=Sphingomonas nostoxanthinifaciens TaxID=2872652 RepID=UPI001CC1C826|nr:HK97 family phage prohead protease [Sphingomonas nostoxanthinifaciens]UAK23661.1 HK97 family phage prohead protease [Sphingomonas nostoxanthinifaciens]